MLFSQVLVFAWFADPVLRVHAPSRLELEPPKRVETGMVVAGRLVDEDTSEPLPQRVIHLGVDGPGYSRSGVALTDEAGGFRLPFAAPFGRYFVHAGFGGDSAHDGTRTERTVDLGRRPLSLRFEGPPARIRRGERAAFHLYATSDGEPADVKVEVSGSPVRLRDGAIELVIAGRGRGPQRLTASFPGDAQ